MDYSNLEGKFGVGYVVCSFMDVNSYADPMDFVYDNEVRQW